MATTTREALVWEQTSETIEIPLNGYQSLNVSEHCASPEDEDSDTTPRYWINVRMRNARNSVFICNIPMVANDGEKPRVCGTDAQVFFEAVGAACEQLSSTHQDWLDDAEEDEEEPIEDQVEQMVYSDAVKQALRESGTGAKSIGKVASSATLGKISRRIDALMNR